MLNHLINGLIDFCCLLQGKRLNTVTKKNEYQVYVSSGECLITNLTDSELICRPPSKEPSPRLNEDKLFIRVSNYFFFSAIHIHSLYLIVFNVSVLCHQYMSTLNYILHIKYKHKSRIAGTINMIYFELRIYLNPQYLC